MTIDEAFFIERRGVRMVLYAGVLQQAHQQGIRSIDTQLIQAPGPGNGDRAIVKATVEMEDGSRWPGLGGADPTSTSKQMVPHLLRLAETRAKARALKDAINVAVVSMEEMGEGEDPNQGSTGAKTQASRSPSDNGKVTERQANYLKYLVVETGHDLEKFVAKHGHPEDLDREKGRELIDRYKALLGGSDG